MHVTLAGRLVSTLAFGFVATSCGNTTTYADGGPPEGGVQDTWAQVSGDGFGFPTQGTVPEMEVFNGNLYVSTATAPNTKGQAKLYRSSTGDAGSWKDVTPPLAGDSSIHSFGSTTLGGGYLWCATGSVSGAMIFRSQNGVDWIPIATRGFGNSGLIGAAPHMVLFQGPSDVTPYLYAGMGAHGGGTKAQVWRIPYTDSDPAHWVKLFDFNDVSDSKIDLVSYFYVWNSTVYFATNAGAQLWESTDGTTFTKNTGVADGFGDPNNRVIASLEAFNGYLYATTTNPTRGGQVWRTGTGTKWEQITADAFGKGPSVSEVRSVRASFGKLWATGYTDVTLSKGTPVWRSDDGVTWVQSNTDGFGDSKNNGENAITMGFGDYQYYGGPNYTAGGQLWRTKAN